VTILTTNLVTGVVSTNNIPTNLLSGSIFIYPTNECGLSIISVQSTNITSSTNPPVITFSNNVELSQSVIIYATNYTVRVNPVDCSAPGFGTTTAALREGVNQIRFVRRDYDSLLGNYWAPVTNVYSLTAVQGNQPVVQTFRRVVTRPDFLFSASDLNGGPNTIVDITQTKINGASSAGATEPWYDTAHILNAGSENALAGPGTLTNQYQLIFNKIGPFLQNTGPDFLTQENARSNFVWGSFDASTNTPIIYPATNGPSFTQLEAEVFMQITSTNTLPDAQEGVQYSPFQLTGTGGTPPYVWSVAAGSGSLPPGFNTTLSTNVSVLPDGTVLIPNGTISGKPATGSAGTYDVTIQMTDFGGRSVQSAFTLTVDP
jgi:hypothetical protein